MPNISDFVESGKRNEPIELKTFIDLFAGIGGFRLAMEAFRLKCVFSSEWDKHARKTYRENFGETPAGDITKIDAENIPPHDVLCAGFPCQAFSISGKRKGFNDARGTLFYDIARIAESRKPKILILENVKNFERHDNGKTLRIFLRILDELDYHVFYDVLNASHYGLPTSRERIYFVCFKKSLGARSFHFPAPTFEKIYLSDMLEYGPNAEELVIKRKDIKIIKRDAGPSMRPVQIGTINKGGQGERRYSANGHAITLSAYGGGIAAKTGAYMINGKIRRLTPRECARLMGFPDSFKIAKSRSQAYKQFGNSVPVKVLVEIMKEIFKTAGNDVNA